MVAMEPRVCHSLSSCSCGWRSSRCFCQSISHWAVWHHSGGWGVHVTEFNPRETILIFETTSEAKCCLAVCWQIGCWPCRHAVAGDNLQCVTCSEVWPAHTYTCWIFHTECIQSSVFSKRIPNALHKNLGPEGVNSVKSC